MDCKTGDDVWITTLTCDNYGVQENLCGRITNVTKTPDGKVASVTVSFVDERAELVEGLSLMFRFIEERGANQRLTDRLYGVLSTAITGDDAMAVVSEALRFIEGCGEK